MAEANAFEQHRPKMVVALLLTFASGIVDIIGYLGIFHFFTAHLTGTTVHLGDSLVNHDWTNVVSAGVIVGMFVIGSLVGRVIIEAASRKRVRKVATITLAMEAAILSGLAIAVDKLGTPRVHASRPVELFVCLAVLAAAMGLQTATLTGIGPLTVHTTFVTGMLNKFAQLVAHIAFRTYDLVRSKGRDAAALRSRKHDTKAAVFLFLIWVFYVAGAAFGTWSYELLGLRGLFFAVGLIGVGIATDQFHPLSVREEKEQSER